MHPPPPSVQTLPSAAPATISIRLASLALLFQGPPVDPFAGSHDGRSGMDHVEAELKRLWGRSSVPAQGLELVVPAAEASDGHLAAVRAAIAGWREAKVDLVTQELRLMAEERRRAWIVGGLFFAACFAVATALETTGVLQGLGGAIISESIIIAGWVGLWHPLDLTLYAWWTPRFRQQILDRIGGLKVSLRADDAA